MTKRTFLRFLICGFILLFIVLSSFPKRLSGSEFLIKDAQPFVIETMYMPVNNGTCKGDWDELSAILINIYGVHNRIGGSAEDYSDHKLWPVGVRLGNGDIGVTIDGDGISQNYFISKTDFWDNPGWGGVGKARLGGITISANPPAIPVNNPLEPILSDTESFTGETFYKARQDIIDATATINQNIADRPFTSNTFVEQWGGNNLMIIELTMNKSVNSTPMTLYISAWTPGSSEFNATSTVGNGFVAAGRETIVIRNSTPQTGISPRVTWQARAVIALTLPGEVNAEVYAIPSDTANRAHGLYKVTMTPGQTVKIVSAVDGQGGIPSYLQTVDQYAQNAGAAAKAIKDDNDIAKTKAIHSKWWKNYWLKSYVQLNDEWLNKYYYGALYAYACNIQEGKVSPGISGLFATIDQTTRNGWSGAYFLNYNYQANFWGALSSNRPELARPFNEQTFGEALDARERAAVDGFNGVLFERTFGPRGRNTAGWNEWVLPNFTLPLKAEIVRRTANDKGFWNWQKSIASFQAIDIIKYYNYTMDKTFLRGDAYQFIVDCAEYYTQYMTKENINGPDRTYTGGPYRWTVWDSGSREHDDSSGSFGMKNSTMDIAYCAFVLRAAIEWSDLLGVNNKDRREVWKDILDHLSDLPTTTHPIYDEWKSSLTGETHTGVRVLCEIENGAPGQMGSETQRDGNTNRNDFGIGDNVDNCSGVWPGELINIGSDPKWVEIAKNTVEMMNMPYTGRNRDITRYGVVNPRSGIAYGDISVQAGLAWSQNNNFPKVFGVAARSGYDAEKLYHALRNTIDPNTTSRPHLMTSNLNINDNMHGLEKVGAIEAINSMLMQSHEKIIRLFPVWPKSKDAKFVDMRARGAFLVSSEFKDGKVLPTTILSEAGETLTLQSPWEKGVVITDKNGMNVESTKGLEVNTGFVTFQFQTEPGEIYYVTEIK